MAWVLDAVLLVTAVAALGAAAMRVAGAAGARGLARGVAAAPLAAGAAAVQALVLGLAGSGSSPVLLTLVAVATWLLARRLVEALPSSAWADLLGWWSALGTPWRVAAGAVAGAVAGWSAWLVAHPSLGGDGLLYHLPKIAAWVEGGHPGRVESLLVDNPFGAYPGANEVVLAWATGIARSMVPMTVWAMPLAVMLLGASAWVAGRALGAPPGPLLALVAALCAGPLLVVQAIGPYTDLPALAWAACAAALALVMVREQRPALAGPLVMAAALAVGTKTTVAPPVVLALAYAAYGSRGRLRAAAPAVAMALPAALLVGGLWYVENLVAHGSPVWPFASLPGGDPVPPALQAIDGRAIADPLASVASRLDVWALALAGHLLLLGGALLAPLVARRREVVAGAAATLAAILVWALSPTTGFPSDPTYDAVSQSALRYLTPALVPALLTLALAARVRRGVAVGVVALGLASVGWSLGRALQIGFPAVPGPSVVVAAAIGAAAALALSRAPLARLAEARVRRPAAGAAALLAVGLLAGAGPGYVDRHLDTAPPAVDVMRVLAAQPGFADGDRPVAMAPHLDGIVTGRRLQHPLELIGLRESCSRVRARAREGYVMLDVSRARLGIPEIDALDTPSKRQAARLAGCFTGQSPLAATPQWLVFGPASP